MNIAIIGYGSRGEIYGDGFAEHAKIVAVCDIKQERLAYAEKKYAIHKDALYTDENAFFEVGS